MMKCLVLLLALSSLVYANKKLETLNQLFTDYWNWKLFISPTSATSFGYKDEKYASRLPILTMQEINKTKSIAEMFLNKGIKISKMKGELSKEDGLSLKLFIAEIQGFLDGLPHKGYMFGLVTYLEGPHKYLVDMFDQMRKEDEVDYLNLLSRLTKVPEHMQQIIEMLRESIKTGMTMHFYSMDGVIEQIHRTISDDKIFKQSFEEFPDSIPVKNRKALQSKARSYLDKLVYPAFMDLADFIKTDYMKNLRANIAATSLPNGKAFYQYSLEYYTTTAMTPQQVYDLGIVEVGKMEEKLKKVISELGYPGMSLQQFSAKLRHDPKTYYDSEEEVLSTYKHAVHDLIQPQLHKLFWTLPKQNVTVVNDEDPLAVWAYYMQGSTIAGRPGKFFIAGSRYSSQSRQDLLTLSMHEANPGHHLHFSLIQENQRLPEFRKYPDPVFFAPSGFQTYQSFIEGWALYAETLGYDMGLYQNDKLQEFGHLTYSILRAVRLVVDTGMHALGWSRQQAIDYMLRYTPMAKLNVELEINRYITWPGQACAYKIGELKIQELRKRSERLLADEFDIRDFHETIINCYGPLHVLEDCVDDYIKTKSKI